MESLKMFESNASLTPICSPVAGSLTGVMNRRGRPRKVLRRKEMVITPGEKVKVSRGRPRGRPRKVRRKEMVITPGEEVEVTSNEEGFKGAWYKATILQALPGTAWVRYQTLLADDSETKLLEEKVEYSFIRPSPPLDLVDGDDKSFEEQDVVDVLDKDGWWEGVVAKVRVLDDNSMIYTVVFNYTNPPEESEYRPSFLRLHMHWDWVDGQWIRPPKAQRMEGLSFSRGMAAEVNIDKGDVNYGEGVKSKSQEGDKHSQQKVEDKTTRGGASGLDFDDRATEEVELPTMKAAEPIGEKNNAENGCRRMEDCTSKQNDAVMGGGGGAEDCTTKEVELRTAIGTECGLSSGEAATGLDETRERRVAPPEPCTVNNASLTGNQTQITPFIKKSPVWKGIETLEVFQTMPQNPHFRPLFECEENCREGSAIGVMVTFSNLVKKIQSLQFDDPKSVLESTLDNLIDLEKHGFDIVIPQGRLNELLSIKDTEEALLNESKVVETQVRKHTDIRRVLESLVEDKDHEISECQVRAEEVNRRRNNARHDFEKLVAAPWKLP